ncbi:hypothetical protein M422DRAFT_783871 [Sphaerobolus stellatus SS14]|uniref:Uncharacterized protein n=1 Tax=Sphaerobolus stellatus (strain SS14) TaxID=990650 RepID=A0A0C9V062_SPHS4|nr:hypothetical protein M422DRAFT_783871 [Sphaerobolus stellatus SS14]
MELSYSFVLVKASSFVRKLLRDWMVEHCSRANELSQLLTMSLCRGSICISHALLQWPSFARKPEYPDYFRVIVDSMQETLNQGFNFMPSSSNPNYLKTIQRLNETLTSTIMADQEQVSTSSQPQNSSVPQGMNIAISTNVMTPRTLLRVLPAPIKHLRSKFKIDYAEPHLKSLSDDYYTVNEEIYELIRPANHLLLASGYRRSVDSNPDGQEATTSCFDIS